MDSYTEDVGLILPVFLRILPDMLCDEWPSDLLTRLKYTLCVLWSKKKNWNFNCRSCAVIRPTPGTWLTTGLETNFSRRIVMSALKIVFLQNSFQFSMSALILSMYYDFRIKWDWDSLFQSSTNPLVSNSPPLSPLLPIPDPCWRLLRRQTNFHFPPHQ